MVSSKNDCSNRHSAPHEPARAKPRKILARADLRALPKNKKK
jgi:hypothetical protein